MRNGACRAVNVPRPWVSQPRVGIQAIGTDPSRTSWIARRSLWTVSPPGVGRKTIVICPFDRLRTAFANATPAFVGLRSLPVVTVKTTDNGDGLADGSLAVANVASSGSAATALTSRSFILPPPIVSLRYSAGTLMLRLPVGSVGFGQSGELLV